jgi:hypothetical protein
MKPWKALHLIMCILKQGNNNTKRLVYMSLVRPILEYGVACWDPCREWQVSALNRLQRRAAKFANHINESGWQTLTQRRLITRLCALYKAYTRSPAWKATGDSLFKPCYLSREDHSSKVRSRKQRTDVGKYSFVKRTTKDWNSLPAGILASFVCKLNTLERGSGKQLQVNRPLAEFEWKQMK